ncbi:DUF7344 domain-containing protein [Halosimplex halobium]|uniref:DUF7344 domain-containing protein n=1 Tax=Halosimplex halobium TaxID=3396618 RepID=UPI003F56BB80
MQLLQRLRQKVLDEQNESATTSIPPSDAYAILQNERRRLIVEYLAEMDSTETDAGEIADHLASRGENRQHAYIAAIQQHLPRIAQSGLISYDNDRKTVTVKPVLEDVWEAHCTVEEQLR